ncbi:MAG: hypothetical protein R2699_04130 [Acidimicrobiales bacterium]
MLLVAMLGARWVPAVLAVRFGLGVFGSAFYTAAVTTSTDLNPHGQALGGGGAVDLDLARVRPSAPRSARPRARRHRPYLACAGAGQSSPAPSCGASPRRFPAGADATPAPDPGAYEELAPGLTGAGPAPTVPRATAPGTRLWLGVLHPAAVLPGLTLLTLGLATRRSPRSRRCTPPRSTWRRPPRCSPPSPCRSSASGSCPAASPTRSAPSG